MSDAISVAVIAALSSVIGSFLTFIVGIRSVRRSVSTSNGEPLGRVLEARPVEHLPHCEVPLLNHRKLRQHLPILLGSRERK